MLGAMGYKALLARTGKEAIEVYKKYKDKIDLVILDIIMPDMGTGEVYDTLKEINPDIKVLLSSGYGISSKKVTEILERGCRDFIQKPFSIKQLSQNVRRMLDPELLI
jgi:two-component system cell cycle sensor histidine kinase/response regulator CckA